MVSYRFRYIFSKIICLKKAQEPRLAGWFSHNWKENTKFYAFPKSISAMSNGEAYSRIRTLVAIYDDNHYITSTSMDSFLFSVLLCELIYSTNISNYFSILLFSNYLYNSPPSLSHIYILYIYIQISLNIIDIFCLHIFFWIRSYCRIN